MLAQFKLKKYSVYYYVYQLFNNFILSVKECLLLKNNDDLSRKQGRLPTENNIWSLEEEIEKENRLLRYKNTCRKLRVIYK